MSFNKIESAIITQKILMNMYVTTFLLHPLNY